MLYKIGSKFVQAIIGCNHLVVFAKQLLQKRRLVGIKISLLRRLCNSVIQVQASNAKLFSSVLVDQLDRGMIFFRALEIVTRDVGAEDALGQLIMFKQRCARKADERSIG